MLIVTFNILIVTKTSINDFTDAALWPLLFLTAYEVTAQNCISEVHLFRILTFGFATEFELLGFVPKNRKISYAASFGVDNLDMLSDSRKDDIRHYKAG